jgi:hypothetical protein
MLKMIELLNAAGYRVEFCTAAKDGVLPAGPACVLTFENTTLRTRGVDPDDALRGAVGYVLKEVEGKRIAELKRRGELHAALSVELERKP